jgi:hypothetical protein
MDYKKRVEEALFRHHEKDLKIIDRLQGKGRRNKKPEKEVESACLSWMRSRGWSIEIYEAKATQTSRGWRNQAMKAGTCDCMGATKEGQSVAIEFKAPGRLSSFNSPGRMRQKLFILKKISSNCFACVVDSVERLETIYLGWCKARVESVDLARAYLMKELP